MANFRNVGVLAVLGMVITLLAATPTAQRPAATTSPSNESRVKENRAPKVSDRQRERLQDRVALATAVLERLAPEAAALGRADGWRQASLESLLEMPLTRLQRAESEIRSADDLAAALKADDPNTLGSSTEDLVFTPIVPCRYIDTRNIAGKITGTRGYDLALSGAAYGGAALCNPTTLFGVSQDQFGGIAMNVTIVDPAIAPGFVAVKPVAAAGSSSLVNWYEAGPTVQVANQSIVTIDQNVDLSDEFVIEASAAVHVIVDIFGAFLAPEATALQQVRLATGFVGIPAGGNPLEITSPSCPAGYTVSGGGCVGSPGGGLLFRSVQDGPNPRWLCGGVNTGPDTVFLQAEVICLRVPGR